jgi:hypothetical protein
MSVIGININGHLVYCDAAKPWRWYEVIGPSVTKWVMDSYALALATDVTITNNTVTAVGTSPLTMVAGADGGALLLTSGGTENNGVQFQPVTEGFYFASAWPAYFGCKLAINDVDQSDFLVGLTITDTSAASGVSDGLYFWSVDESAVVYFGTAKGSVLSSIAAVTMVDAAAVTLEFQFDGTNVTAYVNGTAIGSVAWSAATFPNDEYLTPMIAFLTGEASANTLTLSWAKALQIRET